MSISRCQEAIIQRWGGRGGREGGGEVGDGWGGGGVGRERERCEDLRSWGGPRGHSLLSVMDETARVSRLPPDGGGRAGGG